MLAIVVVNQSIIERPPFQDNELSTRQSQFRPTLRQSLLGQAPSSTLYIHVGSFLATEPHEGGGS